MNVTALSNQLLDATPVAAVQFVDVAMLALAVVLLTIVMFSTRRRIRESQKRPVHTAREQYARMKEQSRTVRDVEQVLVELDQFSRQVHGRLDTKLARLEALIRDADARIAQLSRLTGGASRDPQIEVLLGEETPDDSPQAAERVLPAQADVLRLADAGHTPMEIARQLDRPVGEIELVLALRRTQLRSNPPTQVSTSREAAKSQ